MIVLPMLNNRVDNVIGRLNHVKGYLNDSVDILEYEEDEVSSKNLAEKW